MMPIRSKIAYLLQSGRKRLTRKGLSCPSCGCLEAESISRKYVVTELVRCARCRLQFRTPTISEAEYNRFYQEEYSEGFTTEMPSPDQLEKLKQSRFRGGEKDYSSYLSVLAALGCGPGISIFDYGCSWGYGSWQLREAGYRVAALEISAPRREFAVKEMGIEVYAKANEVKGDFDVFFSAHVLEHVASPHEMIHIARQIVRPGGWIVLVTPNGSDAYRRVNPKGWQLSWGMVHPNSIDNVFYDASFKSEVHLITSSPYDVGEIHNWAVSPQATHSFSLNGPELVVAAKLPELQREKLER